MASSSSPLAPAAASAGRGSGPHAFSRDLASHFCVACQDAWPGNDGVVSKFHKCSNCGLSVHTGCRYIAKRCYPCIPNAVHPKLLSADLLTLETRGRIMCQLLHAFDVPLPDGTSLYGVFKISVSDEIIKSSAEALSGHECVWSTPEGRGGGARRRPGDDDDSTAPRLSSGTNSPGSSSGSGDNGGSGSSSRSLQTVAVSQQEPHSNGIVYLHKTPDMLSEDDYEHSLEWFWSYDRERLSSHLPGAAGTGASLPDAVSSSSSICSPPLVELEIWKSSLYGLFDTMIMTARISVLPLLLHPNVAIERWFRLKFVEDGRSGGSALVRMAFAPCAASSSSLGGNIRSSSSSGNVRAPLTPLLLSPRSSAREEVPERPQPGVPPSRQESDRTIPKPLALVEPLSPGPAVRSADIREDISTYSPTHLSTQSVPKPEITRNQGAFKISRSEYDPMAQSMASESAVFPPIDESASHSPEENTETSPKSLARSLDREMSSVDNRVQSKERLSKDVTSGITVACAPRNDLSRGDAVNVAALTRADHSNAISRVNNAEDAPKAIEVQVLGATSGNVVNREEHPHEKTHASSDHPVQNPQHMDKNSAIGGDDSAAPETASKKSMIRSDSFDRVSVDAEKSQPVELIVKTEFSGSALVARPEETADHTTETTLDSTFSNKLIRDRSFSDASSSRAIPGAASVDRPAAGELAKQPPQDEDKGSEGAIVGWFARTARQLQNQISALVNDEGYRAPMVKPQRRVLTSATASTGVSFISSESEDNAKSVGKLSIKLIDAYRTDVQDAAEGDYFAVVSIVDSGGVVATVMPTGSDGGTSEVVLLEEETHIVRNNAAPRFNRYFEFDVPHFRCSVRLTLIEAVTGRKVGVSQMSVFSLIQRDSNLKLARIRDKILSKGKFKAADSTNRLPVKTKRLLEAEVTTTTNVGAEAGLRQRVGHSSRTRSDSGPNFTAYGDLRHAGIGNRAADDPEADADEAALELLPMRDTATNSTVLGRFNAVIRFHENSKELFSAPKPLLALSSPPEPFSMDRLKEHIGRVKRVFGIMKDVTREHDRIMQWEDPIYTFFLLVFFVYACLRLDAEYALCVPLFLVVVLMTRSLYRRSAGELERFVIERPPDRDDAAYRPHAVLRVAVCGFKNFTKKSFLSSNPHPMPSFIKISYLPNALAPPVTNPTIAGASATESQRQTEFVIGIAPTTQSSGVGRPQASAMEVGHYAPSPGKKVPIATSSIAGAAPSGFSGLLSQLNIISGDTVRDGMLHNMCDPWPRPRPDRGVDLAFVYPILLPESKKKKPLLEPAGEVDAAWLESDGVIRFSLLSGDNQADGGVLGSILVPLKELLVATRALGHKPDATQSGSSNSPFVPLPELAVWCPVKWASTTSSHFTFDALNTGDLIMPHDPNSPIASSSDVSPASTGVAFTGRFYHEVARSIGGTDASTAAPTDVPLVLLRMQLQIRDTKRPPSDEEIEISRTLQTMLSEAPIKSGGAISTLMGVPEMAKSAQNAIGSAVSKLESLANVFNWTVPDKTIYVYVVFVALWLVACLIPGRYIILGVGIFDFFYAFTPQPEDFPMQIKVANALQAIPNTDDLEQVYAIERRQFLQKFVEKDRAKSREARLRVGLDCRWEGVVFLKSPTSLGAAPPSLGAPPSLVGPGSASAGAMLPASGGQSALAALFADPVFVRRLWGFGWAQMFLVVQGHRVVWWQSWNDVDEGAPPLGQIVLYGHAGTTQASPVEMREVASLSSLGPEAAAAFARGCLLCVFGRSGPDGAPAKVSLLCTDPEARKALEAAASEAIVVE